MLWRTHSAFGAGVASLFTVDPFALGLAGFLSVMPDFDRPFGHRGWFSHSFFAAFVFGAVAFFASMFNLFYAFLVLSSVSVHILLDFFTLSGVPLLFPLSHEDHGLRLAKSKDIFLNKAFLLVGLVILAINLGGPEAMKALERAMTSW